MRAQVTVFIILGVLILAAFAVVIFVATSMTRTHVSRPSAMATQSLQDYVSSCLESVSKEGILLLGKQGGYLSGGSVPTVSYGGYSVAYDLMPPNGTFAYFYSEPPMYPYDRFPYIYGNISLTGFYGLNRIPALFKSSQGSIQQSLEQYISAGMDSCADFSVFPGVKVTAHDKTVSVILAANKTHFEGERFFTVLLDWPMNATRADGERLMLEEFAVKVPVRLASTYYFVNGLINRDVSDIGFEPVSDKGFDVAMVPVGSGSIVKVSDPMSVLGDAPFEFWYARMNRRPALWYVDVGGLSSLHTGTEVSIRDGKLLIDDVCDDEDYEFPLFASDPDNDTVAFRLDDAGFASAPGPGSFTVYADDGSLEDYQVLSFDIVQCP